MPGAIECAHCGQQTRVGEKVPTYCAHCGGFLPPEEVQNQEQWLATRQEYNPVRIPLLITIIGIGILGTMFIPLEFKSPAALALTRIGLFLTLAGGLWSIWVIVQRWLDQAD